MDAEEIGRLIADLENRVERLRSLYEQYFMGIERIEPLTARKDVDRRLWSLRREQIRNTGLRFKLETTIQRYNTYQQYWQRIVREIEAGTYQRDLGRAAQRFGDNAVTGFAKRRQKMFEKALTKKAERDALRHTDPGASQAPPAEGGEEASSSASESFDVTFEDSEAPEPASTRRPDEGHGGTRGGVPIAEPIERLELDIGGPSRGEPPPLPAGVPSPVEQRRGPPVPPAPAARAPAPPPPPRAPLASSSGLGVPQGPPPPPRREIAATGARPAAPAMAPAGAAVPAVTAAKSWTAPVRAATPVATPARSAAAAPKAPAPPVLPAPPAATAGPASSVLEKPAAPRPPLAAPALLKPPAPAAPIAPAVARPPAPAAPIAPAVAKPPAPAAPIAPAVARPPAPAAPIAPAVARPPAPVARPPVAAKPPAPAVRPPAPSRPEVSGPAVLGEDNSLSPIRMRQIYGAFVEAKRRANESTASVTYEKIASNLQNVAKELRAKHKARSVDFEVILKNGKPVLKPVVKS